MMTLEIGFVDAVVSEIVPLQVYRLILHQTDIAIQLW